MHPEQPDDVDQSYREAFSGLFGEEPQEPADEEAEKTERPEPKLTEPKVTADQDDNAETGELAGLLPPASILPPAPLAAEPEEDVELVSSVGEALGEKEEEAEGFDPGEETRGWVADGKKSPSGSWLDLKMDEDDATATVQRKADEQEAALGHGGDETTRAMSADDVDDVLRDMERRVRELHGEAGNDTVVDMQAPAPVAEPAPQPIDPGQENASTSAMLETWIRKNVTTTGVHFEHVGTFDAPSNPSRKGAALEIGDTHIRYLELEPRPSGDLVATRFEQVALAESAGTSVEERTARIAAALAALEKRVGKLAPCTVHFEQSAVFSRLLTLPGTTRRVDAAVAEAIASSEPLASDMRVVGQVRVGGATWKSVLTAYSRRSEVERLQAALRAAGTPALRVTSGQVAFLEHVVPAAARRDEDAAEAFVLIEKRQLTVALAARGVLLLVLVIPLEQEAGTQEYVDEVLAQLKKASEELERACGGGELSRIRHLVALPAEVAFPAKEIVVAFGRPAELIDTELLFRIELGSVEKLAIPADAVSLLSASAHAATCRRARGIDIARGGSRTAVTASWALAAAVLVAAIAMGIFWEPRADERRALDETIGARMDQVKAQEGVKAAHDDALRLRDARRALDDDRRAVTALATVAPDPERVLADLAALREGDVYYDSVHVARDGARRERWQVDLEAVPIGEREKAAELGSGLVLRAKNSSLVEVSTRVLEGKFNDEYPLAISARTGGGP